MSQAQIRRPVGRFTRRTVDRGPSQAEIPEARTVNSNGTSLPAMVDFYRDVLGLGDKPRPEIPGIGGHWHTVGDQELHLVDAPSGGPGIDPTGHHYCVAVVDLDAAIAELEARGIAYERAVQGEGTVQIWITDPAGNTIELQQEA